MWTYVVCVFAAAGFGLVMVKVTSTPVVAMIPILIGLSILLRFAPLVGAPAVKCACAVG
jgi:hypothetical protein